MLAINRSALLVAALLKFNEPDNYAIWGYPQDRKLSNYITDLDTLLRSALYRLAYLGAFDSLYLEISGNSKDILGSLSWDQKQIAEEILKFADKLPDNWEICVIEIAPKKPQIDSYIDKYLAHWRAGSIKSDTNTLKPEVDLELTAYLINKLTQKYNPKSLIITDTSEYEISSQINLLACLLFLHSRNFIEIKELLDPVSSPFGSERISVRVSVRDSFYQTFGAKSYPADYYKSQLDAETAVAPVVFYPPRTLTYKGSPYTLKVGRLPQVLLTLATQSPAREVSREELERQTEQSRELVDKSIRNFFDTLERRFGFDRGFSKTLIEFHHSTIKLGTHLTIAA